MGLALKRDLTLGAHLGPVVCPLCQMKLDVFTKVHLAKHGLTKEDFLGRYPEFKAKQFWGTPSYVRTIR